MQPKRVLPFVEISTLFEPFPSVTILMIFYVMNQENQTFEKKVEEKNHQTPDYACPHGPVLPAVLTAAAETLAEIGSDPVHEGSSGPMAAFIFNHRMIDGFWIAVSHWNPEVLVLVEEWRVVSRALRSGFVGGGFGGLAVSTSDFLV